MHLITSKLFATSIIVEDRNPPPWPIIAGWPIISRARARARARPWMMQEDLKSHYRDLSSRTAMYAGHQITNILITNMLSQLVWATVNQYGLIRVHEQNNLTFVKQLSQLPKVSVSYTTNFSPVGSPAVSEKLTRAWADVARDFAQNETTWTKLFSLQQETCSTNCRCKRATVAS